MFSFVFLKILCFDLNFFLFKIASFKKLNISDLFAMVKKNTFWMDYLKKSIKKLNLNHDYEEIDTRLASGWYVDEINKGQTKSYKTKKISYRISKKIVKN